MQIGYFYSTSGERNHADRMEVDFLIARSSLQRRHNVSPVEVKSAGEYETKSLEKFARKFGSYIGDEYILHPKDVSRDGNRHLLPLYMASLIG